MSQAGGGQRGYTYSPDGRWWWDGQRWQPVHAVPARGPATDGRWLIAVVVLLVVGAAVPLALVATVIAFRISHPSPPGPTLPPPSMGSLADASVTGIELAATSHGLQCGRPPLSVGFNASTMHICRRTSGTGALMQVGIIGPDDSRVALVSADVVAIRSGGLRPADASAGLALLQAVVSAAVAGPDGAADAAWVSAHYGQAGASRTAVNGVMLQLKVTDSQRSLFVGSSPI